MSKEKTSRQLLIGVVPETIGTPPNKPSSPEKTYSLVGGVLTIPNIQTTSTQNSLLKQLKNHTSLLKHT